MTDARIRGLLMVGVVLIFHGCAGGDGPVPVEGILLLDEQPVRGATVTFHPLEGSGRPASGFTQVDGSFALISLRPGDGAFPGTYRAVIQYYEPADAPEAIDQEQAMKAVGKPAPPRKPRYVIPAEYRDPARSPLVQKVPAEGKVVLRMTSRLPGQ